MAIKNNKVSAIIEEQIPDFIREEHDNFVQFMKSYYEFLESESPPTRLPLIVANPFPTIYNPLTNPYGGQFQIGETIQQKANSLFPDEVTASAKVFSWSEDETTLTVVITSFGGTSKTFVKDVEIVGVKSGAKFFPVENTESIKPGALRASLDLLDTKDIDNTLEDYVQYIKNEFAVNLPLKLHENTDTRKALKNIREFYKARGTENSFKFLFRLIYGEDISIYLPETDMLRASDANWKNVTVIRTEVPTFDFRTKLDVTTSSLGGRKIKGEVSLANAIVEKAVEVIYGGFRFVELELSNKQGTFIADEYIMTDNVGDGTVIRIKVLGLMNNVNITDPGSNYAVGDRVVVNSDSGSGAVAEVATTNATSGAITSMKIVDPGYEYTSAPTLDMTAPHNADAGAARFEAGPLETIYYNDFSQYTGANSFFAESDNRGANSNVGPSTNSPYVDLAYKPYRAVIDPAMVTSNSVGNFVTVPGVDEGLKGYWKMNSYHPKDVTINTADGTFGDSNDPVANGGLFSTITSTTTTATNPRNAKITNVYIQEGDRTSFPIGSTLSIPLNDGSVFNPIVTWVGTLAGQYDQLHFGPGQFGTISDVWGFPSTLVAGNQSMDTGTTITLLSGGHALNTFRGPRVGDVTFVADPQHESMRQHHLNYINYSYTNPVSVPDRTGANTYISTGHIGFQPVVYDESGHGHHAYVAVSGGGTRATGEGATINVYSEAAFANDGIYGAGSNSLGTFGEGGIVLMPHDDIRNANTQSWVFWYKPHVHDTTAVQPSDGGQAPRIITRDRSSYWSLAANSFYTDPSTSSTTEYTDMLISVKGAKFDNDGGIWDVKLANSSGHFPGGTQGTFEGLAEGDVGALKLGTWNMIAITLDYNTDRPGNIGKTMPSGVGQAGGVGNVYIFNTDDGLLVANGFTFFPSVDANVSFDYTGGLGWENGYSLVQGRAVVLGENCESANGDTFSGEGTIRPQGQYDEVRYYDKALSWNQIEHLFYNPGGRFDKTLSGDWKVLNQGNTNFYNTLPTTVEFIKDEVYEYDDTEGNGTFGGELSSERVPYAGGGYLRVGDALGSDGLEMWTTKNIPFNPTVRYKMSVRAKANGSDSTTSNAVIGLTGISNTGLNIIGGDNVPSWTHAYRFVQSQSGGPDHPSSLGPGWFTYRGVYGGNTAPGKSGWIQTPGVQYGHGANALQLNTGPDDNKKEYTWSNPAKLFGDPTHASSNVAFVRPTILLNLENNDGSGTSDQTLIDYIKIEQQREATLTAEFGAEFKLAGEYLDDSGKIGTSTTSAWRQKYIQDDKFYHIYSYVIKSGLSFKIYDEVVKKLVHPAGLVMFGQVDIESLASVAMQAFLRDKYFLADVIELVRTYYLGAESSLLSDYSRVSIGGYDVGYKAVFGLNSAGIKSFKLDASHGETPHGAGRHTIGSPGWIAWDQSPLTSPYANSHYYANSTVQALNADMELWPYDGPSINAGEDAFPTSNAYTTVTDNSLIWHIKGFRTILGTAYQNANVGALFAHSQNFTQDDEVGSYSKGWALATGNWDYSSGSAADILKLKGDVIETNDWYHKGFGITSPLEIDGNLNRYVRMKVRRIGPGGYGADSWLGVCQPETKPAGKASLFGPTMGLTPTEWGIGSNPSLLKNPYYQVADRSKFYGSANTAQPSTLIIPPGSLPDTKSPWHILEWDMSALGTMVVTAGQDTIVVGGTDPYPSFGGASMWTDASAQTGTSSQNGGTGRRIGHIGFHLCYEPDNANEKFEIEWIQVDNGIGWPRGSYALPAGYVSSDNLVPGSLNPSDDDYWESTGAGTGGIPNRIRTSESSDFSNQTVGDFSVTVSASSAQASEISTGAPVLYVHSDKNIINAGGPSGGPMTDQISDANGAIFRVSANTANNLDWIVTEVIDSEKFLRTVNTISGSVAPPGEHAHYIGGDLTANGRFSGPVILNTDAYDNLYVGYVYENHDGGYPRFDAVTDSKPLMLFRLTPTDNVQSDLALPADPHDLRSSGSAVGSWYGARGRSNTYSAEQILWGNTGGTDGVGVMVGGLHLYGHSDTEWAPTEIGGASGSFVDFSTDDLGSLYVVGSGSQNIIKILPTANNSYANGFSRLFNEFGQSLGRRVVELANPTTLDANNDVLGNWRPTNIIPGPKDSLFVACDTGYDPTNRGANSVYCYHVVTTQNLASGQSYTKNVYPVFANTSGLTAVPSLDYDWFNQTSNVGMSQSCAGMVLDHEEPPNLYYMTANNMYRIKPKGYSYQIGDTEIEQVFPEDYFRDTLKYHGGDDSTYYSYLGFTRHGLGPSGQHSYLYYQNNYQQLQVDSRNRIYFGGMANLFCYSRGSNTNGPANDGLPLYNQSNTEFSTLQVVVNTAMYTSNVDFDYGAVRAGIESFVLGAKTSNSAFTGGDPGNPSAGANNFSEGVYITMHDGQSYDSSAFRENGRRLIAIYPNANGSFVTDEGGQLAMTIMDEDPAANTKFAVDGTGGHNKFRGIGPGKVALRPEKV